MFRGLSASILVIFAYVSPSLGAAATNPADAVVAEQLAAKLQNDAGWESKTKTRDGIQVFQRHVAGTGLLAFKGVGIVEVPISRMASILVDTPSATEWVDSLAETRVVKGNFPMEYFEYDHFRTPPIIMRDRDFVSAVKVFSHKPTKSLIFRFLPTSLPEVPENPQFVRGELINSVFMFTPIDEGKHTLVRAEVHCDPKGSIPEFLVNFFQSDWPINTIRGLRRQGISSKAPDQKVFTSIFQ